MIDGRKVVAWTPYGREKTVSILHRYMLQQRELDVIDEWWLCLNVDDHQTEDLQYAYKLARQRENRGWLKIVDRPSQYPRRKPKQRNTGYFYLGMTEPDTIYVRLDDDIVYIEPSAIDRIVKHQIASPSLCSFPIIINNSVVSWFLQKGGVIPYEWGTVGGPYCMDPVGWADAQFAIKLHRMLLEKIEEKKVDELFLYQDFPLKPGLQFSVSCFASSGSTYAALDTPGLLVPDEEETWHTTRPLTTGIPNTLIGDALVSHYTFFPQQGVVSQTDILDRYRALAESL